MLFISDSLLVSISLGPCPSLQVYEGKAIVKWVRENSSSPWNRQPVRMDQLLSFGEPFVRRSGLSFRPGQVSYMAMHLAIVGKAVQVRWSSGWREGVVDQYDSILQQHRVVYMDKEARGGGKRGDSYWYVLRVWAEKEKGEGELCVCANGQGWARHMSECNDGIALIPLLVS